jgi:diketogulonate reductase-like aldo/keto reductase
MKNKHGFSMAKTVLVFGLLLVFTVSFMGCAGSGKTRTGAQNQNTGAAVPVVPGERAFDFESRTVTLNNGIEMPILGIGMFTLAPAQAEESVYHALLDGYRLIDTANAYMNERAVGRGIKRSGVPREEIFITTKLWPADYEDADRAIDDTLARLDVEYLDLLLLHQAFGNYTAAYKSMETAVRQGKVRAIGLSNFYEEKFDEIMRAATIPPAVLQNESNPYYHQAEMREYIKPYGTVLNAWFPLGGRGNTQTLFNDATIVEIARAHGKTPAQVIIRWYLQIGNIVIPGSSNPDHILENISIFDFELTDEEMLKLRALDRGHGVIDFRARNEEMESFSMSYG